MRERHGNNWAHGALELMPALHSTSRFQAGAVPATAAPDDGAAKRCVRRDARIRKEVPHAEDRTHRARGEGR